MSSDKEVLSTFVSELLVNLKANNKNVSNVIEIITVCMELVETYPNLSGKDKSDLVIKALVEISKGPDGMIGTSDDLIPASVLDVLKTILQLGIVQSIIDEIIKATKGEFTINNAITLGYYIWNGLKSIFYCGKK
jgi:hypothetical protein